MGKKKRKSAKPRKKASLKTDVRSDILRTVDVAFPDGIVGTPWRDDEDRYLREELYDELRTALRKFRDANVLFEQPAEEDLESWRRGLRLSGSAPQMDHRAA
jgi:hypothetical protein